MLFVYELFFYLLALGVRKKVYFYFYKIDRLEEIRFVHSSFLFKIYIVGPPFLFNY